MSITASESLRSPGEPESAARRKRPCDLALMVFEFIGERNLGGTIHDFDAVEDPDLLAALRACAFYINQSDCLDFGEILVLRVKGIDGHPYSVQFSSFGPGVTLRASRARITSLPLVGLQGQPDSTHHQMTILEDHSRRLEFGSVDIDLAFLTGMATVIGFIDDQDDDPDEDARLAPLLALVMPNDDELREIRANLPPSTIH